MEQSTNLTVDHYGPYTAKIKWLVLTHIRSPQLQHAQLLACSAIRLLSSLPELSTWSAEF